MRVLVFDRMIRYKTIDAKERDGGEVGTPLHRYSYYEVPPNPLQSTQKKPALE